MVSISHQLWLQLGQQATQAALQQGNVVRLCVQSGSMLPSLPVGCWVDVQAATVDQLVLGDIVVYVAEDKFFVHRLIGKQADLLLCKGDNHWLADPPVAAVQLLGRVVSRSWQQKVQKIHPFGVKWLGRISRLEARCAAFLSPKADRMASLLHRLFRLVNFCICLIEKSIA
jgi:signal peptidase I